MSSSATREAGSSPGRRTWNVHGPTTVTRCSPPSPATSAPDAQQPAIARSRWQSSCARSPSIPTRRTSMDFGTEARSSKLATESTGRPSLRPTGSWLGATRSVRVTGATVTRRMLRLASSRLTTRGSLVSPASAQIFELRSSSNRLDHCKEDCEPTLNRHHRGCRPEAPPSRRAGATCRSTTGPATTLPL